MYIYWKDMEHKKEKSLIDNTREPIAKLQQQVVDLEGKVILIIDKLKQMRLWN